MTTQAEAAKHLDLSTRQVREYRDRDLIPDPVTSSLDELRVAYIRQLRESAAGRGGSTASDRLASARAEIAELELAEKRGDLVPRAEYERALINLATGVAQRLRAIPAKVGPHAKAAPTAKAAERLLRKEIDGALEELADAGHAIQKGVEQHASA